MTVNKTFINQKRLRYALIAGGVLWIGWLVSILFGSGEKDLAGQVIGTDYLQFYAAGTTLRLGESAYLYVFSYQHDLEQKIIGSSINGLYGFITPPFLAWLFTPLSALPYIWSYAVWSFIGLVGLYLSLRWLEVRHIAKLMPWVLSWFPVFASISFGQNSLLSLTIFSLTYKLRRQNHLWFAGLVCSLLFYKPQLIIGVGLLWLLEWRKAWKALAGLVSGGFLLAGLCLGFTWKASIDYIQFSRSFLPTLLSQEGFPIWHANTPRAFWQLLLPEQPMLVNMLYGLCAVLGLAVYIYFWRNYRNQPALLFAGAVCLVIWITPHAMIYDWVILLLPAILLWQTQDYDWKKIFALVWVATFISDPLTLAQMKVLPFAVQISVPVLAVALYWIYRSVILSKPKYTVA